jgi:hypothetical protein
LKYISKTVNIKHLFDPKIAFTINIMKTNQVEQPTIARSDLNDLLSNQQQDDYMTFNAKAAQDVTVSLSVSLGPYCTF